MHLLWIRLACLLATCGQRLSAPWICTTAGPLLLLHMDRRFWKEPFSTKQTEAGCREQWGVEPRTLWASVEVSKLGERLLDQLCLFDQPLHGPCGVAVALVDICCAAD